LKAVSVYQVVIKDVTTLEEIHEYDKDIVSFRALSESSQKEGKKEKKMRLLKLHFRIQVTDTEKVSNAR